MTCKVCYIIMFYTVINSIVWFLCSDDENINPAPVDFSWIIEHLLTFASYELVLSMFSTTGAIIYNKIFFQI